MPKPARPQTPRDADAKPCRSKRGIRPNGTVTAGLVETLGSLALFAGISRSELVRLAEAMRPRHIVKGDIVFSQGDVAHEFFVLASGTAVVTIHGSHPDGPPIAVLTGPTWFGDLAIVSDQPRISTLTATTDCMLWVLARRHFEAFFSRHPRLARNLATALIRRVQEKDREFVNQSALALERARLLEALRQGADELAALTDVTRAINVSLDLDQTLGAISTYAARLTKSDTALIFLCDQERDVLAVRASYNAPAGYLAEVGERRPPQSEEPESLVNRSLTVRAVVDRGPVQIADVEAARLYSNRALLLRWGYRSVLVVPLLHDERVIGAMSVLRRTAGEFTKREVELVTTFAGHSSIALEHARLFQEIQAQNLAFREALERQTVTNAFLKDINQSSVDLRQMLRTLVEHATRLCGAASGFIFTLVDGQYRLAADHAAPEAFRRVVEEHPASPGRGSLVGRTALTRRPVHIIDVLADPEYAWTDAQHAGGFRTILGIPMLHEGHPIGVMAVYRTVVRPFTEEQIELLTSFADMAVAAMEKIRLFEAVQARTEDLACSVDELRALAQTTQAVNSSLDVDRVLSAIAEEACRLCRGDAGLITELIESTGEFRPCATWNVSQRLLRAILATPPRWGDGASGRSAEQGVPIQIPNILVEPDYRWRDTLVGEGYRALIAVPLLRDGRAIGTIVVTRKSVGAFAARHVRLLTTFADQTTIALEHARLFAQLQDKAAQLEVVSRHKSDFLAGMSHELRTPLNSIIGFSEVLLDPTLESVSAQEREEFLGNILTAGRHLLRLINDVLDLSKVEAGKMELHCEAVDVGETLEGILATVRPLAAKKRIRVHHDITGALGPVNADPARLKQILYNLLSNAIKFTSEEGHVTVTAVPDVPPGGRKTGRFLEISVTDTGVGIPAMHLDRIFEEFEQVLHSVRSRQEGTGLGLALTKKFVELHGGTIRVSSAPGQGSTFAFTIPMADQRDADGSAHAPRAAMGESADRSMHGVTP